METSWVLLRLACFFDLNKVYHQLPTYLPTYLRTYLPTYLPTYSVIDSCYNDPSKSKYWKLFWATFVKNKTTVTSLTLFYYFHIGFFFSTRNCNYSISYRIRTSVNTAAIWMQTVSVLTVLRTKILKVQTKYFEWIIMYDIVCRDVDEIYWIQASLYKANQ